MSNQPSFEAGRPEPASVELAPVVDPVQAFAAASAAATPAAVPGAGVPLVTGPASSAQAGAEASRVNTYFGVGAVVLLVFTVIVVALLAVFVLSVARAR